MCIFKPVSCSASGIAGSLSFLCASHHLCRRFGERRYNFLFAFQSASEFKPQSFQSQVYFSKVSEPLGEITICFTVVLCTLFGDVEKEKNISCHVQRRERYTVSCKIAELKFSEASACALLHFLIMRISISGDARLSPGAW